MKGFPLILCSLLLAYCMNRNLCKMSDKEQGSGDQPQECVADDVEMNSQLADDAITEESQKSEIMEEACRQEEQQPTTEEGEQEMNQDERDTEPDDRAEAASDEKAGGEGNVTATGEEEQQLSAEGEGEMSQDDNTQTTHDQHKDIEPAGDNQAGDEGKEQGETAGAAKVEEMASQGSSSDTDSDSEPHTFSTTLEGFGYHFKDGKLRSIEKDEPFVFEVKKGRKKFNQAHYEALGEVITEEVYQMLERDIKLKKVDIPLKPKKNEPLSFIFMSEDALTNRNKLMILIHGSGVVRAGQWARSLIINDCVDSGTQIPYIQRAMKEGYGVIVLNTNYNKAEPGGTPIRGSSSPQEHAQYVWKNFVKDAKAKQIYIVAHSFGGIVTVDLMVAKFDEFKKRVQKIAFTDSVHILPSWSVPNKAQKWIAERAVNWVTSDKPLNEELESYPGDVSRRSAGTQKHVETSWFSFNYIFEYFSEK